MKHEKPEGRVHPDTLLRLWLGPQDPRQRASPLKRLPLGVAVALSIGTAAALLLLLKYAIDILVIAVAVLGVGLLLHGFFMRVADSETFSPAVLLVIVLGVGILGYLFLLPGDPADTLSRHMPAWLVNALEWSEQRGWAGTVWIEPPSREPTGSGRGDDAAPSAGMSPAGIPSPAASPPSLPMLVVTASSQVVRAGQHVTLMARAAASEATTADGAARFYDGPTLLATVNFQAEDGIRIASLAVGGLALGVHDIRVQFVGPLGRTGRLSEPLRVTVAEK